MKYFDPLFYTPMGSHKVVMPRADETVDDVLKRLRGLARSYRAYGMAFSVQRWCEGVLWWRVEPGEHTKLALWRRLPPAEPVVMKKNVGPHELRQAKATARHLRRAGRGIFEVKLVDAEIIVTRLEAGA